MEIRDRLYLVGGEHIWMSADDGEHLVGYIVNRQVGLLTGEVYPARCSGGAHALDQAAALLRSGK